MRSTNALALLLVIAAAPFLVVLTACKGGDAAPSTPTASASAPSAAPSDSASNAVVNVAPADAAISSGGAAVTSASASASSSAHALTKREACERARNDFGATLSTHLSCHDDTDCATMYTG
ncbi:MAG: hypothetical protein ACREJX_00585, partial [Polyangiaceae bacterium]